VGASKNNLEFKGKRRDFNEFGARLVSEVVPTSDTPVLRHPPSSGAAKRSDSSFRLPSFPRWPE